MKNQHAPLPRCRAQRGVVTMMFGLTLVVLIGFAGLAIDLGRFFVVKAELQNAMDACALSAATQLRPGLNTAADLTRAVAYGQVFSTDDPNNTEPFKNKVNFQSQPISIAETVITFHDTINGTYATASTVNVNARYAKCEYSLAGLPIYFMRVLDAALGTQAVSAMAVATGGPQICNVIPVGICPGVFNVGDWLELGDGTGDPAKGWFRWVQFVDMKGTNDLRDFITSEGTCEIRTVDDWERRPGSIDSAQMAWNTRFGIYQANFDKTKDSPDTTGYSYFNHIDSKTNTWFPWANWKVKNGVNDNPLTPPAAANPPPYTDTAPFLPGRAYPHFKKVAQAKNLKYADSFLPPTLTTDQPKITSSPSFLETSEYIGSGNMDRRLVIVPTVASCTSGKPTTTDFACGLMLNPFVSEGNAKLEYLGLISSGTTPCGSATVVTPNLAVLVK